MKRLALFALWMFFAPDLLLLMGLAFGVIQHVNATLYVGCFVLCGLIFLLVRAQRDRSSRAPSFSLCHRCHRHDVPTRPYRYRDGRWRITASLCRECAFIMEGVPLEA
ncbi:MAG: hypothetical protein WCD86_08005 [Ktedonobacteraceae bacterium]